jgi:hypothetical protein
MMHPKSRKKVYLEYLRMKISEKDWHGVADCAMDLRELEVEIRMKDRYGVSINSPILGNRVKKNYGGSVL